MRLLQAFVFPPYAVFKARGRRTAVLNLLLCGLAVVPGVVHAVVLLRIAQRERWVLERMTGDGQ